MSDGGLFAIPEQPAVHPVELSVGRGNIAYTTARPGKPCADCVQADHEHATGDLWVQPRKPILPATVKRKQGVRVVLLCAQHANLRREHDAEQDRSDADPK